MSARYLRRRLSDDISDALCLPVRRKISARIIPRNALTPQDTVCYLLLRHYALPQVRVS
jgi:hypothetical protein